MARTPAEQILRHFKQLPTHLREGEQPLFSTPVIWENATAKENNACDLIVTNQRIFGYIYTTFPRERLFQDSIELADLRIVSRRKKSFEAMFRELLISDGQKKVYLRAPRSKIDAAIHAIYAALKEYAPTTYGALTGKSEGVEGTGPSQPQEQEIKQSFERSPVGITLLLIGGFCLEILGAVLWVMTGSAQTGLPLCVAGAVAVIMATLVRRQMR